MIILLPDSNKRILARFQVPVLVSEKLNDFAYLIEMPNGAVRRLHANKLRPYVCRAVGAVLHADAQEFGDLPEYPSPASEPQAGDPLDCVRASGRRPVRQRQPISPRS